MPRSGYADLPLHYGRVPVWLAERMTKLGGAIVEALVIEYGKSEVLKRLSDPSEPVWITIPARITRTFVFLVILPSST